MIKKTVCFFRNLAAAALFGTLLGSCNEESPEIPVYDMVRLSEYQMDTLRTVFNYNQNGLTGFDHYEDGILKEHAYLEYRATNICYVSAGITHTLEFFPSKGGLRVQYDRATIGDAELYYLEYQYDAEGRLHQAYYAATRTAPLWVIFTYTGDNSIEIDEQGQKYTISLSSEDNTGYVCNVLGFPETAYTSRYIINPDLYYLGIYGKPVGKLPANQAVRRNSNSGLAGVGKYSYTYTGN
ncbi:MAG: hypothetical protein LBS80_05505 [Tannerella sp.]|nr:hypothetical protein [Tannerella sp.]